MQARMQAHTHTHTIYFFLFIFLLSLFVTLYIFLHLTVMHSSTFGKGWVGMSACPLVVLACESLHVCTVCIWRCEHARFCVEVFYALYINFHSFIHSFTHVRTHTQTHIPKTPCSTNMSPVTAPSKPFQWCWSGQRTHPWSTPAPFQSQSPPPSYALPHRGQHQCVRNGGSRACLSCPPETAAWQMGQVSGFVENLLPNEILEWNVTVLLLLIMSTWNSSMADGSGFRFCWKSLPK